MCALHAYDDAPFTGWTEAAICRTLAQQLKQKYALEGQALRAAEILLERAAALGDREVIERRQILRGRAQRAPDGLVLADAFIDEMQRPAPSPAKV